MASGLIAIALLAGLQALDVAALGAQSASHQAWGRCLARGELEAVSAAAWSPSYPGPGGVTVRVTVINPELQKITVMVADPRTGAPLGGATRFEVYKALALSGPTAMTAADTDAVLTSCKALL